jgi:WD40 repeat protein
MDSGPEQPMTTQSCFRSKTFRGAFLLHLALLGPVWFAGCGKPDDTSTYSKSTSDDVVPVLTIAVSPDGRTIACCNRNGTVTLRDRDTLNPVRTLSFGRRPPVVARFHPRGDSLLVGYYDGSVALWDMKALSAEPVLLGTHDKDVRAAAFSHDGRTAVTGDGAGDLIVWNVDQRLSGYRVLRHQAPIWSLAFSNDDRVIASGGSEGIVRLWDVASGRSPRILAGHQAPIRSLDLSRDGKLLISAGLDSSIRAWDFETGRELWKLNAPGNGVIAAVLSPNADTIAVTTVFSGDVQLWNVASRKLASTIPAHEVMANDVAFTRDGTLVSCGMDGDVHTWLIADEQVENGTRKPAAVSLRDRVPAEFPANRLLAEK